MANKDTKNFAQIAEELHRHPSTISSAVYRLDETAHRKRKARGYDGCNKDCYNCPYKDCLAPASVAEAGLNPDYWVKMKDGIREDKLGTPT